MRNQTDGKLAIVRPLESPAAVELFRDKISLAIPRAVLSLWVSFFVGGFIHFMCRLFVYCLEELFF
jgi:hypothetical protein